MLLIRLLSASAIFTPIPHCVSSFWPSAVLNLPEMLQMPECSHTSKALHM